MTFAAFVIGWFVIAQAGSPIVPPAPVSTHTDVNVTVQAPPPDPKAIAEASTQSFEAVTVTLIAPTLAGWVNDLLNVPDFIRTTPPGLTYDNAGVKTMQDIVMKTALALLALAIFCNGASMALGQRAEWGRLIMAVLFTITELAWWRMGIDVVNGINATISAPSTAEIVKPHMQLPTLGDDPIKAFAPAVLLIVYCVVVILLMLNMLFRLAMIDILIVAGPIALMCGGVSQSSEWHAKYLSWSVGFLFSQVPVVICLKLAPIIGGLTSGVAGAFLSLAILLLARRLPIMMGGSTPGAPGGNLIGRAFSMLVLRKIF